MVSWCTARQGHISCALEQAAHLRALVHRAEVWPCLHPHVEERLRIAEIIWESLAADPSSVPLSDAHRTAIDERLAEHERDPDDVVSKDEVLREARRG